MMLKRILSGMLAFSLLFGSFGGTTVMADTAAKSVTITVNKDGSGDFTSIQAALDSIKDTPTEKNRAMIKIYPGVYTEEVNVNKPYVTFSNASRNGDVTITYDKANGHADPKKNYGTDKTATVTVTAEATGFTAENITFVNSYNIDSASAEGTNTAERKQTQAVALETLADKVVLENCKMIGRQDTLYLKGASKGQQVSGSANPARVYLKNCYIEGTVDFIFGDATAFFDNCELNMVYYKNGGHFSAPNTTLYNIGYVFNNCILNVDKAYTADYAEKIDLGRPWQCDSAYPNSGSNSVYINCTMPDIMKEEGFSLWDSSSMAKKVRFMEYGSKYANGRAVDLTKRADFVKVLTQEQADGYTAYNVLKGSDNWDPSGSRTNTSCCDVTLSSYDISIPMGESFSLKAYTVPMEISDKISYSSADASIASIDADGNITGLKEGKTVICAENSKKLRTYADVEVTAARTAVPTVADIKITNESNLVPGQNLIANYGYELASDNAIDAAKLRWCAVNDDNCIILKEGVGEYYSSYTVTPEDIGYSIRLDVYPATKTTYGEYGAVSSYTTANAVKAQNGESGALYRTDFDNTDGWSTTGTWNSVNKYDNSFVAAACDSNDMSYMEYSNGYDFDNIDLKGRFRFNPERKGLSSDGYYNIYFNRSKDASSYYVLKVGRGSNTKSLILTLCKVVNGVETELAKDVDSLKNNILQNAGEENPYFTIEVSKNNSELEAYFYIEGISKYMAKLSAKDSAPVSAGTIAFEAGGDDDVVMMDSISVRNNADTSSTDKTKIYIMGDSTAVAYGDDNTIGGWGEYLVNYFNNNVEIINKAEGGRSARSYLNQGRLREVYEQVGAGDYVFIQFGTNDQRTDENAFMEHAVMLGEPDSSGKYPIIPGIKTKTPQYIYDFYKNTDYPYGDTFYPYESGTFKWYMLQHVQEIKKTGATPVLLTPMCRIFFDSEGKITPHFGEKDGYIEAIRQLAEEEDIVCIDMYDITKSLYESYGVMTTQGLHNIKSDGTVDLTHYNKFGANLIASKMADAIKNSVLTVRKDVIASSVAVSRTDALKTANLFVLGSTAASGADNGNMAVASGGYGDYFGKYLSPKITVKNLAVQGATTRSYIDTDEYKSFVSELNEGDYVFINFGETDGRAGEDYAYPSDNEKDKSSYSYYLYNYYIKPVADKKAVAIVMTPYSPRTFVNGEYAPAANPYVQNTISMVQKYSTAYVNLNSVTAELYKTMGEEGSKALNAYNRKTGIDNNVLSSFGAELVAKKILTMMQQSSASLKDYIDAEAVKASPSMTKADFVKLVSDAVSLKESTANNFNDVSEGKYYSGAVGAAKAAGIIKAVSGDSYKPETPITGNEASNIIKNTLKYLKADADMSDVYELLKGDSVSFEIGVWAIDRLYEELK